MNGEYYMTRPEELAKFKALRAAKGYPDSETTLLDIIHVLAGDDDHVFNAMWSFWNCAQAFDDLLDESGGNAEQIEAVMTGLHDAVVYALVREGQNYNLEPLLMNMARAAKWDQARIDLMIESAANFFSDLYTNPFIRKHRQEMRCIFVQAMTRALDGDEMERSGNSERMALAPAVRCGDLDALFHMVYLARGWAALRAIGKFREYDLPTVKEDV